MDSKTKRAQSFPLRMSPVLLEKAQATAKSESISLNHFVCLALAEKLSRLERDCWVKQFAASPEKSSGTNAPWIPTRKVPFR
jgi:hypothetical protein